ncbi:Rieske (2Fe-2S) protein [Saliphagus sp. LR7]|uniref:Rieske (2Fe-2S) protein n=1 Tax=Saliphagus sp. LR7 TaxID=2282654 RepID=UPI000DF86120|nr:Rieske (2Fe-2S) protein [Saliphagus sp. LR7]
MAKNRYEICPTSELEPGDRRIVTLDGFSVGVFNIDGEYFALKNDCPHQRAPLCEGKLSGTTRSNRPGEYEWERDGQIISCPWHGWEFDVTTGESVFNPHEVKTMTFEATTETDVRSDGAGGEDRSDSDVCDDCGVELQGDEPPVETYDVEVEEEIVVIHR